MSSWLARRWLAPVEALATGARGIAQGHLHTRVPVHGNDELAQLARTFNTMAEQLGSIEASRRQWLGDVAHELRTPLAAMRAGSCRRPNRQHKAPILSARLADTQLTGGTGSSPARQAARTVFKKRSTCWRRLANWPSSETSALST